MLPGIDIVDFIVQYSWIGVALIVFAESGLLFGFFLPGDTLLFTSGFLVSAGIFHIDILLLVLILFIAAVTGDSVGYAFGSKVGKRLYQRPDSRLFKKAHLEAAEKFYAKYGGKTIIFARFIPAIRTFAPIVAGASNMKYHTFLLFNIIGGALWTVGVTYLGYFLGGEFKKIGLEIDQVIFPAILIILFLSMLPAIVHLIRNPDQRKAIWTVANRQIYSLFGWNYDKDSKPRK
ncbi:MAG: VTT domain-containing protein [Candidatus Saccharimonadales bacterium]